MKKKRRTGVVLFQLGGPDSLDAVEPFLYNLFSDPDIIDLPGAFLFRNALARFISSRRAPKVRALYDSIGGKSPILKQTMLQATHLAALLARKGLNTDVRVAMRYWHPFTSETAAELFRNPPDELILLPLYPQYSKATTASSFNEWDRVVRTMNVARIPTKRIESYFDHPLYIDAIVEHVTQALDRFPKTERGKVHLVFSAHGIPMKLVNAGDPYPAHIRRSYELVLERGRFNLPHHLCFQSKVGPQKWLQPSLTTTIERLAAEGVTHMVVVPIAFVTDHIETLSEINIEARKHAFALGVKRFEMMRALTASKKFIACLADLVMHRAKG